LTFSWGERISSNDETRVFGPAKKQHRYLKKKGGGCKGIASQTTEEKESFPTVSKTKQKPRKTAKNAKRRGECYVSKTEVKGVNRKRRVNSGVDEHRGEVVNKLGKGETIDAEGGLISRADRLKNGRSSIGYHTEKGSRPQGSVFKKGGVRRKERQGEESQRSSWGRGTGNTVAQEGRSRKGRGPKKQEKKKVFGV